MPIVALSLKAKQIISFLESQFLLTLIFSSIYLKSATFATGRISLGIFYSVDFISFFIFTYCIDLLPATQKKLCNFQNKSIFLLII